ncbi:glycosyltransferase family 39 protein [Streptomyces sp. Ncost-T10-10d]|uniref:glycosyltransferase family 39 protein n=1 Tax=Streptomyces sp. Ncost-T10-10d TaxID=1839774 RepID=UPI00081EE4BE|nr:glycosyltransferase family 39 protein [Streptomyces sp. Ncost-T10-10d]SCF65580.1 Dolichyl-phosphate-mannose-protein mannosyltransferase [Streptomyces sp. Ncost-T10-10d]
MTRTTARTTATATPSWNARLSQQPATTGPGRRRRLRRTAEHYGPVLAVYGTLKFIGFAAFMWLLHSAGDYRTKNPRFGGGARPWDVLASWDGWWYQQIAVHGYDPGLVPIPGATGPITLEGNSAAFFPLYPALMRLVSELTGLGPYGAGLLVSVVASLAAALGIYAVTERLGGRRAALAAAGLWAVWPGSGVEWAVYSDSLYVALAVWACHAVLSRRWLTAGLLACVAGLNRPTAVALIAAVAVAALLALHRPKDGILRPVAAMALAPLGLLAYLGWVGHQMGDYRGYFRLQSGAWAHEWDYGRHTLDVLTSVPVGHFDYLSAWPFADLIGVGVVLLALALLPLLIRLRPPAVLTVYTVLTLVLVLGSQQIFGNVSRYLLPLFPLFLPLALALRRLGPAHQLMLLAVAALASGSYAGYGLFELGVP